MQPMWLLWALCLQGPSLAMGRAPPRGHLQLPPESLRQEEVLAAQRLWVLCTALPPFLSSHWWAEVAAGLFQDTGAFAWPQLFLPVHQLYGPFSHDGWAKTSVGLCKGFGAFASPTATSACPSPCATRLQGHSQMAVPSAYRGHTHLREMLTPQPA